MRSFGLVRVGPFQPVVVYCFAAPPEGDSVPLLVGSCWFLYPLLGAVFEDNNFQVVLARYKCHFACPSVFTSLESVAHVREKGLFLVKVGFCH